MAIMDSGAYSNDSTEKRKMGRTADEVHEIWEAIDGLRSAIQKITTVQAGTDAKLDQLLSQAQNDKDRGRTQWGVLIAAGTFILLLFTSCLAGALAPLYLYDANNSKMIDQHVHLDGHPHALQLQAAIKKDVERIDGDLNEIKIDIKDVEERSRERQAELRQEAKDHFGMFEKLQDAKRKVVEVQLGRVIREQDRRTGRVYDDDP